MSLTYSPHDPLCPALRTIPQECQCPLIEKVIEREQEKNNWRSNVRRKGVDDGQPGTRL